MAQEVENMDADEIESKLEQWTLAPPKVAEGPQHLLHSGATVEEELQHQVHQPLLHSGAKISDNTVENEMSSYKTNQHLLKSSHGPQIQRGKRCVADKVAEEFKEGFKNASCSQPTWATVKTTLITLFLGIIPSFLDFFTDIIAGVSYLTKDTPEYIWGGTKCFTL